MSRDLKVGDMVRILPHNRILAGAPEIVGGLCRIVEIMEAKDSEFNTIFCNKYRRECFFFYPDEVMYCHS